MMENSVYDLILAEARKNANERMINAMRLSVVINISNVAEYFFSHEQDVWDMSNDFPNIAPPFPDFWMEFTQPQRIAAGSKIINNPMAGFKTGVFFNANEIKGTTQGVNDFSGWGVMATVFDVAKETYLPFLFRDYLFLANESGRHIYMPSGPAFAMRTAPAWRKVSDATAMVANDLYPCLLALSFLHCKNVVVEDRQPRARRTSPPGTRT